jgi:hypothetical protein
MDVIGVSALQRRAFCRWVFTPTFALSIVFERSLVCGSSVFMASTRDMRSMTVLAHRAGKHGPEQ